jgi:hypothetical protein
MSQRMKEYKRYDTLPSEAMMQTYTWLLMVVGRNGRYEKTLELPFVPHVGMTIFRGGTQLMWGGLLADHYSTSPAIEKFGWNIDEERFEVEISVSGDLHLNSPFWDQFCSA